MKFHAILKSALEHAMKWQLVKQNVANLADPPKARKKEIVTLNSEEIKRFLISAKDDPLYIVFFLAVTTGLRRGEILGLRWKDINWENKSASIQKNVVVVGGKVILQEPKTKGSKRAISLPQTAIDALKKHKTEQTKLKLKQGILFKDQDLIITTRFGHPISPRNLLRSFYRIIKDANLPKIRFHDLRYIYATLMSQFVSKPNFSLPIKSPQNKKNAYIQGFYVVGSIGIEPTTSTVSR